MKIKAKKFWLFEGSPIHLYSERYWIIEETTIFFFFKKRRFIGKDLSGSPFFSKIEAHEKIEELCKKQKKACTII